jgi:hypothetical protein
VLSSAVSVSKGAALFLCFMEWDSHLMYVTEWDSHLMYVMLSICLYCIKNKVVRLYLQCWQFVWCWNKQAFYVANVF